MITRIKRVAQFLFDNADIIAEYMCQSDNFRTVEVDFRVHKTDGEELGITLLLYDEVEGLHELLDYTITKKRFIQLRNMINEDAGVTSLPKPVEVRDKLNPLQVDFYKEYSYYVGCEITCERTPLKYSAWESIAMKKAEELRNQEVS